ncbi:Release factor glutamine methyltransferase [Buchnera aphidicola (Phyllaphis fagi)]|uniref:peptide chain release factor N(5)-glutamine methyltransferase n=1 Tax=Buchnera aphidicola TaxID=9 RepID=UPI0034647573
MKIQFWLEYVSKLLYCFNTSKLDSEILISQVVKQPKIWVNIFDYIILSILEIYKLNILVKRRINCEPIAYIIKKKEFWSFSLTVSRHVLIPRQDTEILVQEILNRINLYDSVLDLGCGSGAISLSVAFEKPYCNVIGVDYVKRSVILSKKNAKILNLDNAYFYHSNWFSLIRRRFNIIVSNPPYINKKDMIYINKDCQFEPMKALVSKHHGLLDIKYIIKHSYYYLFCNGWLLIEHGWKQKKIVSYLFKKYNFFNIMSYNDYHGYHRITVGKKIF